MVAGEKFVFDVAYEEVGVARPHFGSHCNTVDLFVVVVTKRKTFECENQLENSLAFLHIKLSINDNALSSSVQYKPTDSHYYLLQSSSHPQPVKNAIPFSQFLRLRRLCSDDSDCNNKCEEMCQFFKRHSYPDSAVTTGKHHAQEIDREAGLQTTQNEETDRSPFTLPQHPQNLAIKNVIFVYIHI